MHVTAPPKLSLRLLCYDSATMNVAATVTLVILVMSATTLATGKNYKATMISQKKHTATM